MVCNSGKLLCTPLVNSPHAPAPRLLLITIQDIQKQRQVGGTELLLSSRHAHRHVGTLARPPVLRVPVRETYTPVFA